MQNPTRRRGNIKVKGSPSPEQPPHTHLDATNIIGYSLDLTNITSQNIEGVISSMKTTFRVSELSNDVRSVDLYGKTYDVPQNITVSTDSAGTTSSLCTCKNGADLRAILTIDASFRARYSTFAGDASCSYPVCKSFRDDCQYVLYNMNTVCYTAELQVDSRTIHESCAASIRRLPVHFIPKDLQLFREFFRTFGSHVIVNTTHGSRFNSICWISSSDVRYRHNLSPSVLATLEGITSGEQLMASIEREETSRLRYASNLNESLFCQGGNAQRAASVNYNPGPYRTYSAWLSTASVSQKPISVGLDAIWTIASLSSDPTVCKRAQSLEDAFNFITSHPSICKTPARLNIMSDWAEFTLTTPGALLVVTEITGTRAATTMCKSNRIQWGAQGSCIFEQVEIQFAIYYDGSPINFYTGHGSIGSTDGESKGEITVTMGDKEYRNCDTVDDILNIKHFQNVPTSEVPEVQIPDNISAKLGHLGLQM
ncbi:hypothetical protein OBBRIDRAFT_791718 [Obba rivulosa]|uniref:MACPF domain-containing protein n=1 Tax=Obba rivulosa TaxID=1052685 RepID=A0A8E2B1I4_9APHY|nr:hypothetical protein OBBRIDRAFT_791718 [Obba rivulosa]